MLEKVPGNPCSAQKTFLPVKWSLMLKSVEHGRSILKVTRWSCEMIFDAEKRWARRYLYWGRTRRQVKWSLMLKSVEHGTAGVIQGVVEEVKWSLMLKSVEHAQAREEAPKPFRWNDLWCWKALSTAIWRRLRARLLCEMIFDAEKRWALQGSRKTLYAWRSEMIFDAEKRWARGFISRESYGGVSEMIFDAEKRWALFWRNRS